MPTNHYDLIVLGDDFSGLVAATLCARRGLRVLYAQMSRSPSSYQLGPYRLPIEPLPLVGLSGAATRRVLDELHFQHLLKRKLFHAQPPFQLVGPDARIAIDSDDAVLGREAERELGQAGPLLAAAERASRVAGLLEPIFALDVAVPPTGFWERREMGRVAGRLLDVADEWQDGLDGELERALLCLPAVFGTNSDPTDLSPVACARAFAEWRQGIAHLPGDWEALRAIFLDKFTSHNGEVRVVEPESFATSWGKVTGLRLLGGEELGAGHVVAAMPVADMDILADRKLRKRLAEVAESIQVGAYRYTLNLVLDEIGVPEGMGSNLLMLHDPSAPLVGDNALALFVDQPDAEARVAITVQAICPAQELGSALDDAMASLRVGVRERLESVMPFHAEHVRLVHSPHESAAPEAARDGLGHEVELAQLVLPRPLWRLPRQPMLGVAGLSYQIGMKQFIVASSQILPGLGLEGEMAAGWCAAKLVCEAAGKKKDYLRDEVLTASRG
jgi:phytoene dehydrogenase-like protein